MNASNLNCGQEERVLCSIKHAKKDLSDIMKHEKIQQMSKQVVQV